MMKLMRFLGSEDEIFELSGVQHSDVQLSTMILPAWVGKETLPESSFAVQACFIVRHCIAFSSVKSSCRTIALADLQLLRRTQTHELMLVKCEA